MNAREVVAEIRRTLESKGTNPFRAALESNLPGTAIRHVLEGKQPRLSRLVEICEALDLELYVGPRRVQNLEKLPAISRSAPAPGTPAAVRDRELAAALAAIVEHWEALGSEYARRDWLAALWATSAALGARRSALRRVVAWLGWRVIEGGAAASEPGSG